jgi:hypothetical protein
MILVEAKASEGMGIKTGANKRGSGSVQDDAGVFKIKSSFGRSEGGISDAPTLAGW